MELNIQGLEVQREIDWNQLTREQFEDLSSQVVWGSMFTKDYSNNFNIPSHILINFSDYVGSLREEDEEGGEISYWEVYSENGFDFQYKGYYDDFQFGDIVFLTPFQAYKLLNGEYMGDQLPVDSRYWDKFYFECSNINVITIFGVTYELWDLMQDGENWDLQLPTSKVKEIIEVSGEREISLDESRGNKMKIRFEDCIDTLDIYLLSKELPLQYDTLMRRVRDDSEEDIKEYVEYLLDTDKYSDEICFILKDGYATCDITEEEYNIICKELNINPKDNLYTIKDEDFIKKEVVKEDFQELEDTTIDELKDTPLVDLDVLNYKELAIKVKEDKDSISYFLFNHKSGEVEYSIYDSRFNLIDDGVIDLIDYENEVPLRDTLLLGDILDEYIIDETIISLVSAEDLKNHIETLSESVVKYGDFYIDEEDLKNIKGLQEDLVYTTEDGENFLYTYDVDRATELIINLCSKEEIKDILSKAKVKYDVEHPEWSVRDHIHLFEDELYPLFKEEALNQKKESKSKVNESLEDYDEEVQTRLKDIARAICEVDTRVAFNDALYDATDDFEQLVTQYGLDRAKQLIMGIEDCNEYAQQVVDYVNTHDEIQDEYASKLSEPDWNNMTLDEHYLIESLLIND